MNGMRGAKELEELKPQAKNAALSKVYTKSLSAVMEITVEMLRKVSTSIKGSHVTPPERDPLDPEFYTTSLRIPEHRHLTHPLRVYFVFFPLRVPTIEVARVVTIGRATELLSARKFLRAWSASRTGGGVVYIGEPDPVSVKDACEGDILQVLQRSGQLIESYTKNKKPGEIMIWPIDASFRPRLCSTCLLPIALGNRCPKCGRG